MVLNSDLGPPAHVPPLGLGSSRPLKAQHPPSSAFLTVLPPRSPPALCPSSITPAPDSPGCPRLQEPPIGRHKGLWKSHPSPEEKK